LHARLLTVLVDCPSSGLKSFVESGRFEGKGTTALQVDLLPLVLP
jgi:hypothetical protein